MYPYYREGQSAARGPHAALQRFFAAPVTNCNDAYVYYGIILYEKHLKVACFGRKNEKYKQKNFLAGRNTFYLVYLAREQKSLATPAILHQRLLHC